MKTLTAKDKMVKARAGLILDAPFFGSLALRMAIKEDLTCETAYTDGVSIGYNPSFIDTLQLEQVKGLLCHEVMHIAAAHHTRRGDRDPKKWNVAGDHAINHLIDKSGFKLPPDALPGIDNNIENIYGSLPTPPPGQDPDGQGNDPGGCGEVRDYPGKDGGKATKAELEQAEAMAKVSLAQAAQQAKAAGKLPGYMERLVTDILEPEVSWSELLDRFIQRTAKNDYAWTPPNRRFIHMGIYLPSLNSQELKNVIIAVDTSGSISQDIIDQFAAEISAILQSFDTEITVIYCDSSIKKIENFKSEDLPLTLSPIGGGGTDFMPPFQWIDDNNINPACMVYLTDLECSSFPDAPDYPVLWIKYGSYGYPPPFGEVIDLN